MEDHKYLSYEHHRSPDRLSTVEYVEAPKLQMRYVSLNNAWWTLWLGRYR